VKDGGNNRRKEGRVNMKYGGDGSERRKNGMKGTE
jgi:hypothetical protein